MINIKVTKKYIHSDEIEVSEYSFDSNEKSIEFCEFENGNRVKVKFVEYVRLHKIMTNVSTKSVWECLKNGDDITKLLEGVPDEYFNKIKDYKDLLEAKFTLRKIHIDSKFETCMLFNKCSDDKTFALNIQDRPEKHYLFALRKGRDISQMIWKELEPKYEKL